MGYVLFLFCIFFPTLNERTQAVDPLLCNKQKQIKQKILCELVHRWLLRIFPAIYVFLEGLTRQSGTLTSYRIKSGNMLCLLGICIDSQIMKIVKPSCIICAVSVHCHMQIFMTNLKNINVLLY